MHHHTVLYDRGEHIVHILGRLRGGGQVDLAAGAIVDGGDIANRHIGLAALGGNLFHFRGIHSHHAGNRNQIALLFLVIGIIELFGLERAIGDLVIRAKQVGQVGVNFQFGQNDGAGFAVALIVAQAVIPLLDLVHGAPDGSL